MEESTVIQLYLLIGSYTAYRHLYGHLIWTPNSSQSDTPPSKIPNSCKFTSAKKNLIVDKCRN